MYKKFYCEDCQTEKDCIRWKSISASLQGAEYKCDDCWDQFEVDFDNYVKNKF